MKKGGYQIIDLSNIYFGIYSEDQEISLNIPNIEIYRQITNTNKPIVISGLTFTDEFESGFKYVYHDFVPNITFCNKLRHDVFPTIKFDINVNDIVGVETATVTITPTHIKIQTN